MKIQRKLQASNPQLVSLAIRFSAVTKIAVAESSSEIACLDPQAEWRRDLLAERRGASRPSHRPPGVVSEPMFCLTFILTFGYFLANFERLVLGCIEAKFCK